jgi:hypothetical protein
MKRSFVWLSNWPIQESTAIGRRFKESWSTATIDEHPTCWIAGKYARFWISSAIADDNNTDEKAGRIAMIMQDGKVVDSQGFMFDPEDE